MRVRIDVARLGAGGGWECRLMVLAHPTPAPPPPTALRKSPAPPPAARAQPGLESEAH